MAANGSVHADGQYAVLLAPVTITTAVSLVAGPLVLSKLAGSNYAQLQAQLVYGSGGTTAKAYVQTSIDGTNWNDVACFAFTTASGVKVSALTTCIAPAAQAGALTDGSLADNTVVNGLLGKMFRVKYVTTGTYAGGTTLGVVALFK